MKIKVIQVSKRFFWPIWAVLIVLLWFGFGGLTILLSSYFHHPVELCLFKRLTGIPCPTCGFTRGVLTMLHCHPDQAWLYNPLLFSALAFLFMATVVRFLFARSLRIQMTNTERIITWALAILLLCVNWIYVIFYVG